jgi:hypothetical protein
MHPARGRRHGGWSGLRSASREVSVVARTRYVLRNTRGNGCLPGTGIRFFFLVNQ